MNLKNTAPLAVHMHVQKTSVHANPNIGLFIYATDTYAIIGPEAQELKKEVQEILEVPVIISTIAGTSLAGVFLAGNNTTLLVPSIIFDREKKHLQEELPVEVKSFGTIHTALGNNLLINDSGVIAGPMFSAEECEQLQELLELPTKQFEIADVEVIGNCVAHTTKGALIHRDATQAQITFIQDTLQLAKILPGTVNLGQPYVRSGVVANSNGFLIGASSGGPEITNADEALGFIEQ